MSESARDSASHSQETRASPPPGGAASTPAEWPGGLPATLPATFGRYQLLQMLGKGGMGAVFLAHDTQLDRKVALKVPFFTGDTAGERIERFLREARSAATLSHANICPVYDVGQIDGVYFLTMAHVEGKTLKEIIRQGQLLPVRQAVGLVRQLALAMQEAHDHGVIHRDLKPANIMINAKKQPVIMDFGLARRDGAAVERQLTNSGAMLGTPAYMSPEQVNGDQSAIGPASDIYSLGVILYEMLTGRLPFAAKMLGDLLAEIMVEAPRPPSVHRPEIDAAFDAICIRTLAKQPSARFASCTEFAAALQAWLKREPADPPLLDTLAAPVRPIKRASSRRLPQALAAAVLLLLAAIGLWLATRGDKAPVIQSIANTPLPATPVGDDAAGAAQRGRRTRPPQPGDQSFPNSIGLRLTRIPAGEFWMGSEATELGHYDDESPRHLVKITRPFYLGIYEVTQAQYKEIMGVNPSRFQGANLPLQGATWMEAVEFCRKLSAREAEKKAGRVYRLPTEAEWEYACRAGSTSVFHYGDSLAPLQANFKGDAPYGDALPGPSAGQPVEVGSYPPNKWGLYDMHGNVWEWCNDWADGNYYPRSPTNDPPGGDNSDQNWRILRGGAYDTDAKFCRAANRFGFVPTQPNDQYGFRVACDITPQP